MKLIITGSNGLLGQKIVKRCLKHQIPFIATSKGENRNPNCPDDLYHALDMVDEEGVKSFVAKTRPTAIIHTAALTNVDFCELNPEACLEANVLASRYWWEAAQEVKAHFQLLSTDFVFDGENGPYAEDATVHPLSVYARSKVAAETFLTTSEYANWSIARTIIVYGTGIGLTRGNLILWALDALPKGQEMALVNDQFRAPTWADDLAYGCVEIILRQKRGIYHLSGPETLPINEIVQRVAKAINAPIEKIKTIASSELNQPALRPPKTGFILTKAETDLDYHPRSIEETIPLLLAELKK